MELNAEFEKPVAAGPIEPHEKRILFGFLWLSRHEMPWLSTATKKP
jgi:hypothetical protein